MLHLMAKLFTSKTKRKPRKVTQARVRTTLPESMVSVHVNYASYVLPAAKALQLVELLAKAEIYEDVYHSELKGSHDDKYTHHVYANDKMANMKLLPDGFYGMCKLAGKPEKK